MSHLKRTPFILLLLGLGLLAGPAQAQINQELLDQMREPIRLVLKEGRAFVGRGQNFEDDRFSLRSSQGGGQVTYTFKAENIEEIQFPGQAAYSLIQEYLREDKNDKALELYQGLYQQQGRYFRYMPEERISTFINYADLLEEEGQHLRALQVARRIKPLLNNPRIQEHIENIILYTLFQLNITDEAAELAREWVDTAERYGPSAIGWWVLSELDFEAERYKTALWRSLNPITFSGPMPMEHLNKCYVIAIASSYEQENYDKARTLYQEMQSRHIEWPEAMPAFAPYHPERWDERSEEAEKPTVEEEKTEEEANPESSRENKKSAPEKTSTSESKPEKEKESSGRESLKDKLPIRSY